MEHVWERRQMHTEYWWRKLKERDHLEDLRHRWKNNIKHILKWYGLESSGLRKGRVITVPNLHDV